MDSSDSSMIIKTLVAIGLDEKAAKIYSVLLSKNRMGISDIAKETEIKRPTCYEHLNTLLKKNYAVRVPVGKRTYYKAESPKNILTLYKKSLQDFEKNVEIMTKLQETSSNKPQVTFHEGKQSLNLIYERLFKTIGDTYSIFPPDTFFENFSLDEYLAFDKENSLHAFKTKDLFVASKHTKKLIELRKDGDFKNKLHKVLPGSFTTNVDVLIFNETVALISLRDLSAVVIENKDISELFKSVHSALWKSLP